jgi:antitoxin component of MazEF toxin-antitoxin module
MAQIEVITRKWGNSLGIALPKEVVDAQHLTENQRIIMNVKKVMDIKKVRGLLKTNKTAQQIKDEMRQGWG